nr:hypothetical protein [Escherichia coli]
MAQALKDHLAAYELSKKA